jgi:poly(A) polymerase
MLMARHHVLDHFLPDAAYPDRLAGLAALENVFDQPADAIRRLAVILQGGRAIADGLNKALRLSRRECSRLGDILEHRGQASAQMTVHDQRVMLYRLGVELFRDLVLVDGADDGDDRSVLWQSARDWKPVSLPLKGADVLALGVAKGPEIGRHLAAVEAWWIGEDFSPDRDACLARLSRIVA